MSEYEIMQNMFSAIQSVMTVVSLFFTIVSGYAVALYLVLFKAPFALRALAFGLMTIGLVFLGGTAAVIQKLQDGLFVAWDKLDSPSVDIKTLRNPIPLSMADALPFQQQQLGVAIGWMVAAAVYLTLFYLTFVYRWPSRADATSGS